MSNVMPNNENVEVSTAPSSEISDGVSSIAVNESEESVDTDQIKQLTDEEDSQSQDQVKCAQNDATSQAEDSLKPGDGEGSISSTGKADECPENTKITLPVIPLPPDESAQDASDVVMGTTTPADIKDLQVSHDASPETQAEKSKESSEQFQFKLPHLPGRSHDSVEEEASEVKGQLVTEFSEDTVKPNLNDSDSEITFKIPNLLSESAKSSNELTSEEAVSDKVVNPPETNSANPSDFAGQIDNKRGSDDASNDKVEVTDGNAGDQVITGTTSDPQSAEGQNQAEPAVIQENTSADQPEETTTTKATAEADINMVNADSESNVKPGKDADDGDVEMKDDESVASDTKSTSSKRRNSTGSAADGNSNMADTEDPNNERTHHVSADQVFEYQWPPDKTGEYYFLQEQISEYLVVKSFKRKYPDLQRRPVEIQERMFLREKGIVTETQCDLGLTAVRSEEVYDLMLKDYPDKYQDYVQVLQEKERRTISEKHKEYGMPKVDKGKMKEYMKKAVKSAAEFNGHFMRELKEERKSYFDLQTFQVMYPTGQMKKLSPELTKVSAYPVSLIPGQFQEYYKKYTHQELKYFPLNTSLYDPPKELANIYAKPKQEGDSDSEESVTSGASLNSVHSSSSDCSRSSASSNNDQDEDSSPCCHICSGGPEKNNSGDAEELVACSECARSGHPSCLEITDEMIPIIKTYSWQCMECKTCVECMDPYDEDKMMFCDHCDRGYHTFCVGLRNIPTGQWECPSCRPDEPKPKQRRTRTR